MGVAGSIKTKGLSYSVQPTEEMTLIKLYFALAGLTLKLM
jgi:hypothetical protein